MKRIFALMILFCVTVPALAQVVPAAIRADVKSIMTAPQDGLRVILTGTIIGSLGGNDYMFTDGTGHVRISVDADLLSGQALVKGTRIELAGRVNHHLTGNIVTVSVDYITVLKGRADAGKPTWGARHGLAALCRQSRIADPDCMI
jgi:uncharacterized protein YdeI (BOF family)